MMMGTSAILVVAPQIVTQLLFRFPGPLSAPNMLAFQVPARSVSE